MGFTETDSGLLNALADRHSSAPGRREVHHLAVPVSATQQEPSVGFTETDPAQ